MQKYTLTSIITIKWKLKDGQICKKQSSSAGKAPALQEVLQSVFYDLDEAKAKDYLWPKAISKPIGNHTPHVIIQCQRHSRNSFNHYNDIRSAVVGIYK